MLGKKTSLNVATAAGVVFYELVRKYRSVLMTERSASSTSLLVFFCKINTRARCRYSLGHAMGEPAFSGLYSIILSD